MTDKIDSSQHSCSKRKTVHDAVRTVLTRFEGDSLHYSSRNNTWYDSNAPIPYDAYKVCTREEFEKVAAVKKWTHKTSSGYACRIIHEHEGYAWIEYKDLDTQLISPVSNLKPIKPTITKAEAWDMFVNDGWATWDIIKKYDITN